MWHKEERDEMHRGQNMNFDSVDPQVPFVQNIRFTPGSNGPGVQFFPDASRKRKTMEHLGGYGNDVATGFKNLGGNMGNHIQGGYGFQNNVVLPPAVVSPLNTPVMYFDHNSGYAKPSNSEFQHGNGQFYATDNSLLRSETIEEDINRSSFGSCNLKPFCHSESSLPVEIPGRNTAGPHDLQHLAYNPVSQSEPGKFMSYFGNNDDFKEMSEGAHRSQNATTLGHERWLYNPCPYPWTTSKVFPYTDSSHSRMVNEKFISDGETDVQNLNRSGRDAVRAPDQETWYTEGGNTPSGTITSTQTSVIRERREAYDFSRYHYSEIRSRDFMSNDIPSAQLLNARDKEQSGGTIPQLPESSIFIEASVDDRMVNNSTNASKDPETEVLKNVYGTDTENKNDTLVEGASLERDNSLASRPVEHSDEPPLNSEEQRGSVAGSPMLIEKLWDGSLQLNTSTTVSAVAFFKSGEKAQDIKWPEQIEIKGKVRLQAFEKFIQELPRSRNRALMVISLCWKPGSSKAGLTGIKEVAKGYKESEKLGFAQICPSFDLYVCPRSDAIITILAKSGFFKGMAAVEEDQDSLIGCVVWRRGHISSNPTPKISERKKVSLQDQPSKSPDPSVPEINSPVMVVQESESNQEKPPSSLISESRSIPLDSSGPKTKEEQSALPGPPPLRPDLLQKMIQIKKDCNKVPTEGVSANWSMMGIGGRKKADLGFESQQRSADLDDDLPEFDFDAACGPSNLSRSTHRTHFPVASFSDQPPIEEPLSAKQAEQLDLCFPGKPWNTYQADKDSTLSCRWNDEDDDDMPEWCPPDLELTDHTRSNTSARLPLPNLRPAPDNGHMNPDPSKAFYVPPTQNRGFHGYQAGLLGSRPPFVDPSQPDSMPLPLLHPRQYNFNTRPFKFEGNRRQWRH